MKKIVIGISATIAVVIVLLLLAPMFVSIDKFRPQIEAAAAKSFRGKLQLGALSLSAFPKVKIKIDGLTALSPAPFDKAPLATVKSAELQMSLLGLIFSPSATLVLIEPNISILKVGEKSSLSEFLMPKDAAAPVDTKTPDPSTPGVGESLKGLPPFLASRIEKARFSFRIEDGKVNLQDSSQKKTDKTQVTKLNLDLKDIGIRSQIGIAANIGLDYVAGEMTALGDLKLSGSVQYDPQGKTNNIEFDLKTELQDLDFKNGSSLHKPKGTELSLELKGKAAQAEFLDLMIEKISFIFDKANANSSLKLEAFGSPQPKIDFKFETADVEIAPFGSFIAPVRAYSLKGQTKIKALASGLLENPQLNVALDLKNLSGQSPELKHPISDLDAQITVEGSSKAPQTQIKTFKVKIASSDLNLSGVIGGTSDAPAIKMQLSSKNLNVDELMGLKSLRLDNKTEEEKKAAENEKKEELKKLEASRKGGPAMPSLDETLDQMAPELEKSLKNPMLDKASATLSFQLNRVIALGAEYKDLKLNANYAKRKLSNTSFSMKAYQGNMNVSLGMTLIPSAPAYDLNAKLDGVSIGNFLEIHAPSWKGMMSGSTKGNFNLSGQGLKKTQLDKTLNGKLDAQIVNGSMKMPVAAILAKVLNSMPSVSKKVENKEDPKGSFKTCKLLSSIKGRMIYLDDMDVIYDTEKMNLGDMRFQAKGSVAFDRMVDITGTAYLEPGKIPLAGLKGPSGKDEIPLRFKGDMIDPKPDYEYTAKILVPRLAKGALQSQGGQKLKEEAKKKLGDLLGGGGGEGGDKKEEAVKKGLNDLKKKFGF